MDTNKLSPADAAAQIIAELSSAFDVNALVEQARTKLALGPQKIDAGKAIRITGEEAIAINELTARADELARVAKAAESERETIKELLREVAGDAEELIVNGALVVTNKPQTSRILDQAAVKARFPDIEGNEWAYKTTESRRFLFK